MISDWSKYPNFTKSEFDCKYTKENDMQPYFMEALQALRTDYGRPIFPSSGFRSIHHPEEARKQNPGYHTKGIAVDIPCHSDTAYILISLAFKHGFTGIGVSQRNGVPRFIHLDMRADVPRVYSY